MRGFTEFVAHELGARNELLELVTVEPALGMGLKVYEAQRAQLEPVHQQRRSRVETDVRFANHERVLREPRILSRVGDE